MLVLTAGAASLAGAGACTAALGALGAAASWPVVATTLPLPIKSIVYVADAFLADGANSNSKNKAASTCNPPEKAK